LDANKKHIENLSNKHLKESQINFLTKALKFIPTHLENLPTLLPVGIDVEANDGPFWSCCTPLFQSECWCRTIEMELIGERLCKSNSLSLQ